MSERVTDLADAYRVDPAPFRGLPQYRTGPGCRCAGSYAPLRSATVETNGVITTIPPALDPDEAAILNALGDPAARH